MDLQNCWMRNTIQLVTVVNKFEDFAQIRAPYYVFKQQIYLWVETNTLWAWVNRYMMSTQQLSGTYSAGSTSTEIPVLKTCKDPVLNYQPRYDFDYCGL